LQLVLRDDEPLHDLKIVLAQLQTGIGPDLDDAVELLERDRIDLAAGLEDRARAGVPPLVPLHVLTRGLDALPGLDHYVHQAGVLHLIGGIDAPAEHHILGKRRSAPPRQQAVGAHAGE